MGAFIANFLRKKRVSATRSATLLLAILMIVSTFVVSGTGAEAEAQDKKRTEAETEDQTKTRYPTLGDRNLGHAVFPGDSLLSFLGVGGLCGGLLEPDICNETFALIVTPEYHGFTYGVGGLLTMGWKSWFVAIPATWVWTNLNITEVTISAFNAEILFGRMFPYELRFRTAAGEQSRFRLLFDVSMALNKRASRSTVTWDLPWIRP